MTANPTDVLPSLTEAVATPLANVEVPTATTHLPAAPIAATGPSEGAAGPVEPRYDAEAAADIQGNIVPGFNKDHQEFLFLRFGDTDQQGHINNAAYATFCESGRVALLYNPAANMPQAGCHFVIAELTIRFLAEVTFPGDIEVRSRVTRIGRSSLHIEQELVFGGKIVATADNALVMTDVTMMLTRALSESRRHASMMPAYSCRKNSTAHTSRSDAKTRPAANRPAQRRARLPACLLVTRRCLLLPWSLRDCAVTMP